MADIICSGFGGQGVLTAGLILIEAGLKMDKFVTWSPSYGSEMRGGTANCNVIISEEEIGSPYIKHPDIVVAMNEPSVDKFENALKPGAVLLLNASIIPPREYRKDIHVHAVKATDIANERANPKGTNLAMLGALARATGIFSQDILGRTITEYFDKKGYGNPKNTLCYDGGFNAVVCLQKADV